ncbi:hypothetical protein GQ42DRAFT_159774 [Ramicandelaber brevisporus]|nr:hypothetical protein GQ42DRAFT_159774 [Ramicandelaber brevisporus]
MSEHKHHPSLVRLKFPLDKPLVHSFTFVSPCPATSTPTSNSASTEDLSTEYESTGHTVPDSPFILGVDEAGRGPVLGPMVYGIVLCRESYRSTLGTLGFADSKALSESQREALFTKLNDYRETDSSNGKQKARLVSDDVGWAATVLSPRDISASMLREDKYNLNQLAHDTTISLIRGVLARGYQVSELYVDTVGPAVSYENKLSGLFPTIKVTVRAKAESQFPVVAAASIVAKVVRDQVLHSWQFAEGREWSKQWGCGYPSDEQTVRWLKSTFDPVFGFPQVVRFSWSTCENLVVDKGAKGVWMSDLEDTSKKRGREDPSQSSLLRFASNGKGKNGDDLRARFTSMAISHEHAPAHIVKREQQSFFERRSITPIFDRL